MDEIPHRPAGCNTSTPDLDHIVTAYIFCCPSCIHITRTCVLSKPFGVHHSRTRLHTIFIVNYFSLKMAEHFVICEVYI
jgi:hypothetical protein